MAYYFSAVTGVVSPLTATTTTTDTTPSARLRAYVPRASRPHVVWSACQRARPAQPRQQQLHEDDDDDACIGTYRALQPQSASVAATTTTTTADDDDDTACVYGIRQLLTTDAHTGTHAVLYRSNSTSRNIHGGVVQCISTPVPSRRRLACLRVASTTATAATTTATQRAPRHMRIYASDVAGNVYMLTMHDDGDDDDNDDDNNNDDGNAATTTRKRARDDGASRVRSADTTRATATTWSLLAPAHSPVPSRVCHGDAGNVGGDNGDTLRCFAVAHGAPGWTGLASLAPHATSDDNDGNNGDSSSSNLLVCAREHYYDVRVLDVCAAAASASGAVVRSYATTHAPTALLAPAALPHCVLVCEGPLATLYDVRCPSAALTVRDLCACIADEGKHTSVTSNTPTTTHGSAVVSGRLTSVAGMVRDACDTACAFEVAMCVDRALNVYDYRKLHRHFTSSNVLKYDIASVTSTSRGRAVVCAGVDAEVRIIALYDKRSSSSRSDDDGEKDDATAAASLSLAAKSKAAATAGTSARASSAHGDGKAGAAAAAATPTTHPVSTFRTRLNSSVCCETNWQGGWVTSLDGRIAIGVSMTGELFMAQ